MGFSVSRQDPPLKNVLGLFIKAVLNNAKEAATDVQENVQKQETAKGVILCGQ